MKPMITVAGYTDERSAQSKRLNWILCCSPTSEGERAWALCFPLIYPGSTNWEWDSFSPSICRGAEGSEDVLIALIVNWVWRLNNVCVADILKGWNNMCVSHIGLCGGEASWITHSSGYYEVTQRRPGILHTSREHYVLASWVAGLRVAKSSH